MSSGIGHVYPVISTMGNYRMLKRIPSPIHKSVSMDFAKILVKNADLVDEAEKILNRWNLLERKIDYQVSCSCLPKFFYRTLRQEL